MQKKNKKSSFLHTSSLRLQKGISLYLALMIMTILLAIGIGISTIIVSQMKMIREMGDSVIAFYAADTGIERLINEELKICRQAPCPGYCADPVNCDEGLPTPSIPFSEPVGDATYEAKKVANNTEGCPATVNFCLHSVGIYQGVRRAIEVSF